MRIIRRSKEILEIKTHIECDDIHTKEVSPFGNGAKIDFFKKFIGKKVLIVVLKENEKSKSK